MRSLPPVEDSKNTRTRRWDAVILGGALPGLAAAVRLGMAGHRVLLLEEEATAGRFAGLREPFWISGANRDGVVGSFLRASNVPLIDQRRIESSQLAFQLILPDARVDVGEPALTVDEWVAWGLAKPEEARALVLALAEAAEAEREALFEAPLVRTQRRLGLGVRRGPSLGVEAPRPEGRPTQPRGIPAQLGSAPARIARMLDAQVRALSQLGESEPSPEARARLLGAPLEGGASVRGTDAGLREILLRRVESLYGEFRRLPESFRLVSWGGQPGVAPDTAGESGEVWVGRAFVLNAPADSLARAVAQDPAPEVLHGAASRRRCLALHLRADREALPDGMGPRVIVLRDESKPPEGTNLVTIRRFPAREGAAIDLVAAARVASDEPDLEARAAEIQQALADLMPFAGDRIERVREPLARWDDDAPLPDPPAGAGWPAEVPLRLPTKQPIYRLDRAAVAGLGAEGDLLLGWRAGDAISADLA